MKKLIYSFAAVLLGLVSCTTFDDPVTENYGAGPGIDVSITAGEQTDSAFIVNITPAQGATYYAFLIDENDTPEELDSAVLFKGGYGNSVVKVENHPTMTINVTTANPNTTYQVYAVAGNDKGIVGNIVVKSITTTDKFSPAPQTIAKDADNAAVQLKYSEAISRGAGAVTAKYYKEWDIMNPVEVAEDDISVTTSGNAVVFAARNIPAGAYLCFSYAEGAFIDAKGNPCRALNSGLDLNKGAVVGAWVHVTNKPFAIDDAWVTAPENGALIGKVEDFKGEITFPFNVYRNEETVETGDLSVTFTNASRTVTYNLSAEDWSIAENKINFVLPATVQPVGGDIITVNAVEGAISDVCGNLNEAFSSTTSWKFFAPTLDMILGTFDFTYYSAYDEEPQAYDGGPITITENPAEENGLIIKGLFSDYVEGTELEGYYDLTSGKLYIYAYQVLGIYTTSKGSVYGLITYSQTGKDDIEFTINADGTITSTDLGIVACDETFENALGWMEKASIAAFTPKAAEAAAKKKAASRAKKMSVRVKAPKKHLSK